MKKLPTLNSDVLCYMKLEWDDSLKEGFGGQWLTTRAIQIKLRERGIFTSWHTLAMRLFDLEKVGDAESIRTSNGVCWKPCTDTISI